jgi:hypothetical protein
MSVLRWTGAVLLDARRAATRRASSLSAAGSARQPRFGALVQLFDRASEGVSETHHRFDVRLHLAALDPAEGGLVHPGLLRKMMLRPVRARALANLSHSHSDCRFHGEKAKPNDAGEAIPPRLTEICKGRCLWISNFSKKYSQIKSPLCRAHCALPPSGGTIDARRAETRATMDYKATLRQRDELSFSQSRPIELEAAPSATKSRRRSTERCAKFHARTLAGLTAWMESHSNAPSDACCSACEDDEGACVDQGNDKSGLWVNKRATDQEGSCCTRRRA